MSGHGLDIVMLLCSDPPPSKLIAFVSAAGHNQDAVTSGRPCILDDPESQQMAADLQDKARRSLPQYMVPHTIIPVSCLPLSNNGKVVRPTLRSLFIELSRSSHPDTSSSEPIGHRLQSEAEAHLYSIVRSFVYDGLGKDDRLYPECMDSLTVTRFLIQLRADFDISSLSLEFVIQNNTFQQLAAAINQVSQVPRDDNGNNAPPDTQQGDSLQLSAPSRAMRPKLFGVFGVQGISLAFAKLATHMPSMDVV